MNSLNEKEAARPARLSSPEIDGLTLTALQTWSTTVPTSRRGLSIAAGLVLLTVFGIGGTWAATAKLGGALVATGRIFAEGNNRVVQHLEGGIVDDILIKEGDYVKAGQVLIHFDETASRSQLDRHQIDKAIATIELARWLAERDETLDTFEVDMSQLTGPNNSRVQEALANQAAEFKSSKIARQQKLLVLDGKIANEKEDAAYLQKLISAYEKQKDLLEKEERAYLELLEKGLTRQSQVYVVQRQLAQISGQVANSASAIQKSLHNVQSYQDEKQRISSEHEEIVSKKITEIQQRLNQSEDYINRLSDIIRRSSLLSPTDGTIISLNFKSIGAVVRPGEKIAEVLPGNSALMLEAFVNPKDIDKVFINQETEIIFSSDQTKNYPPMVGTVSYISADAFTYERTGAPYYVTHIKLSTENSGRNILPGNVAEVYFKTQAKTLVEYIAEPVYRFARKAYTE